MVLPFLPCVSVMEVCFVSGNARYWLSAGWEGCADSLPQASRTKTSSELWVLPCAHVEGRVDKDVCV